mmetsp:Transcript_136937/g.309329  ORF Transcript_136937/g.309329 Transcript_136937/m.309329 type:complete len:90 (-) Transcript_136937:17-286(-)
MLSGTQDSLWTVAGAALAHYTARVLLVFCGSAGYPVGAWCAATRPRWAYPAAPRDSMALTGSPEQVGYCCVGLSAGCFSELWCGVTEVS